MENRVILLNGPSSSGKSTLSRALQAQLREKTGKEYAILSIDDFMKLTTQETIYEDDVFEISGEMCEAALERLKTADGVIVDHVITSARIFRQFLEMLRAYPLLLVHVACPLEELKRRENARGDRHPGSAEDSYTYLYPQAGYDLTVDTFSHTAKQCAAQIAEFCMKALEPPLLYRAAQAGVFGKQYRFSRGSITDALFVYLDGEPDAQAVHALEQTFPARPLVCLSGAWLSHIRETYPDIQVYRRWQMQPSRAFSFPPAPVLPEGYTLCAMDEAAFSRHPFSHGENYPSFAAFQAEGAGAVVWYGGEIVASASSFLSLGGEAELDVSTKEAHRGEGLAGACIAEMLRDCQKRGITVHWDAQNETSRHLAEKFGFRLERAYCVYSIAKSL